MGYEKDGLAFLIDGFELLKKYMRQYCKLKMLCLAIVLLSLLTNIVRKKINRKRQICFILTSASISK